MTQKKKDYFETILSDVKPLKKSKGPYKEKDNFYLPKAKIESSKKQKVKFLTQTEKDVLYKKEYSKKEIVNDGSSFLKKLKRGKIKINKKVDLHGMTLYEAEKIFDKEIEDSFLNNTRCILFITGKGLRGKHQNTHNKLYYGKIKSNIYNWATKEKNQEKILHFSIAHPSHGGEGSFYIYLRKIKKY